MCGQTAKKRYCDHFSPPALMYSEMLHNCYSLVEVYAIKESIPRKNYLMFSAFPSWLQETKHYSESAGNRDGFYEVQDW
jgi:hypothetical protein